MVKVYIYLHYFLKKVMLLVNLLLVLLHKEYRNKIITIKITRK